MLLIWKGRGLLTGVYLILSVIIMAVAAVVTEDYLGGVFITDNTMLFFMAAAFVLAGLLTYRTSITHVKQGGEKVRVKANHSLFFLPMAGWAIMMFTCALFIAALGIYSFFI